MKKAIFWIKKRHDKTRRQTSESSESKVPLLLESRFDHEEPSTIENPHNSILERLPVELLLTITDHLDDTSKTCLKYTSRGFRSTVPSDVANMDRCTRWLIMTRLEEDAMLNAQQWKNVQTMACALCKTKRKIVDFAGSRASVKLTSGGWRPGRGPEYVFSSLPYSLLSFKFPWSALLTSACCSKTALN